MHSLTLASRARYSPVRPRGGEGSMRLAAHGSSRMQIWKAIFRLSAVLAVAHFRDGTNVLPRKFFY
jgi:hypothetical protein